MKKIIYSLFGGMSKINLASLRRKGGSSNNSNDFGAKRKKEALQSEDTAEAIQPSEDPDQDSLVQQSLNNSLLTSSLPVTAASGDASFPEQDCLKDEFFDTPCQQLARLLLGKILVRQLDNGQVLKGRIVETECYLGGEDQASHSYRGKLTERNAPMFMKPGTAYVYFTYGMYHCFNISSQGPGAAVLIRALEPTQGVDVMTELRSRGVKNKKNVNNKKKPLQPHELCNGPSKLCIAMDIDRDECNKRDLATWSGLSVQDEGEDAVKEAVVVVTKRVGIESAGREWADEPLRFYLLGNTSVSKRDRAREKELVASAKRNSESI